MKILRKLQWLVLIPLTVQNPEWEGKQWSTLAVDTVESIEALQSMKSFRRSIKRNKRKVKTTSNAASIQCPSISNMGGLSHEQTWTAPPELRPWGRNPPNTLMACGVRPTCPITAIPASAIALAAATREPMPPSIFTASMNPSFNSRVALSTACPVVTFNPS